MYFSNFFSRALVAALPVILVTACGGGDGPAPTPNLPNVINVTVDAGPSGSGYNVNRLYTTVKICQPGTTQCETIDHVLVDTGSTGLRLLANVMTTDLKQSRLNGERGFPLLNCVQFLDLTYAWGPVATADVVLGGKTAANVPIQVIADPDFISLAAACSASGKEKEITTAATLGANGIIGLGLFKEDCGLGCTGIPKNGFYYTCTDATCTATTGATASIAKQVKNPVSLFASDNNGFLIDLPAVDPPGSASLRGTLTFGIGTQANNQLGSAKVLTTSPSGDITTVLGTQSLSESFIDSGSNGLYFDFDPVKLPPCTGTSSDFYCPPSRVTLSATLVGAIGEASSGFSFSIDNATDLFASRTNTVRNHVFPTLAGDLPGHPSTFDWGLPFFYGRRVFFGIEGQESTLGTGPFYAF